MGPRAYVIGTSIVYATLHYMPITANAKKLWVVPQRVDEADVREHVCEGLQIMGSYVLLLSKYSR